MFAFLLFIAFTTATNVIPDIEQELKDVGLYDLFSKKESIHENDIENEEDKKSSSNSELDENSNNQPD
ncbi:Hypothetical protein EHI5A_212700, partial [Entamoeba histolytica KU27]